jgi:murein L,D-transpeptidase YcbB/YkuD
LSDKITYLVFNPHWGVPDKIARKDILPKQKKNPRFLASQKIRVYDGWEAGGKEIEPDSIDWSALSETRFRYRLNQDPGPLNALGRVKFMFPNKYDVYLHDTPSKELFGRARRDFSSGCIRVEKPVELTQYLLRGHPDWPDEKIRAVLSGGEFATQTVKLIQPVNIHILYWTAWVGDDASIHFSPDIYDRDTAVDNGLKQAPPGR